ncbi:hypothetical protein DUE52_11810 [Larkinella punicea]|uniref:Uncharacterized protein n=2 Tax=Larkinella punicea TaxID=2315727 RepID=A0A368JS65_9BACT|nr:hypothetical protein DUE52_11810 [Larkinella punicea]
MLYLIWTLLNIALGVYFIILCFHAARLLKERVGLYAAVIFTFGFLSFAGNSGKKSDSFSENPDVKKWNYVSRDSIVPGDLKFAHAQIDKTWISEIDLTVLCGTKKSSNQTVPVEATSVWSGFVSGYDWKPTSISVRATTGQKYAYTVIGILQWKLLGISLYSQHKTYEGLIELK